MSETETVFIKENKDSSWMKSVSIALPNRAMNFGDGIFETMYFDGRAIRNLNLHEGRALAGLQALRISSEGFDSGELSEFLSAKFPGQPLRIRLNLFRSGTGKYLPESNELIQVLQIGSYSPAPLFKIHTGFATSIFLSENPLSKYKTLNALPYVLAAMERKERGLDEIILLDKEGHISEAGFANIFWRKGGEVFTPSLDTGCIEGIGRSLLIQEFFRREIPLMQGKFLPTELLDADQVWICNALGISYLERIENSKFSILSWEVLSEIYK